MMECSESYDDSRAASNSYPPSPPSLPQHSTAPCAELELAPSSDAAARNSTTTTARTSATTIIMTIASIPASFLCPITGKLMEDPVMDSCGHTYERRAILGYMAQCRRQLQQRANNNSSNNSNLCRCPFSQKPLTVHDLIPNHTLGERIDKWRWQQEFDCSQLCGGDDGNANDDLSRFVDVELQKQGQSTFDENQQRQQAAHVDDDSSVDDDEADDVRNHSNTNRGPRRSYWVPRRARRQRQKRYAPVSQQQPPSSPGGALSSSSSGSTRSDDFRPSFPAHKSMAAATTTEWHPELLHVLPQELHILSFVQERSQRERQKNLRDRRVQCVRRTFSILVVLTLLAGAGLGLMLVIDHWSSWMSADGSEGEPSSQERDEWRDINSTATDPPGRLMYERF